jgi:DNA-directed RNA polymerase specialized sigma24 family protein
VARAEDPDHAVAELADVVDQLTHLAKRRDALVARARAAGATWAELAAVLGVTVQAAHKRYRETRHDRDTGHAWREPPLPM